MSSLTAIGLMSGTSLDGVDAALLRTDGQTIEEFGPTANFPYSRDQKIWARRAIKAALEGRDGAEEIGKAAGEITHAHIEAVALLLRDAGLRAADIDVIGFHGQTILHRPAKQPGTQGRSWQIGDGAALARETGIDVVADFRGNDMRHGGEGAPFAPVYHAALLRQAGLNEPVGVLNLGGVANITFIGADVCDDEMIAFDCGPGNGLIDEWMELQTGQPMDKDGNFAKGGVIRDDIIAEMLRTPFLKRRPPKSLDRYDFKLDPVMSLPVTDGAATLTYFTAACVADAVQHLPESPARWVVAGGGRRNPVLLAALGDALASPVVAAEELGWRGDDLEAECFAFLAVRSLKKMPLSFPLTTRVPKPLTGGVFHRAQP